MARSRYWGDLSTGDMLYSREMYLVICDGIVDEVFHGTSDQKKLVRSWFIELWEQYREPDSWFLMLHESPLYTVASYLGVALSETDRLFDLLPEIDRARLISPPERHDANAVKI
jgi:hypothetical protein